MRWAILLVPLLHATLSFALSSLSTGLPPQHRGSNRFFLDSADTEEWAALLPLGIFHGVTTNPVLLKRAGVPCTIESCHGLADRAFELGAREFMLQAWGGSAENLLNSGLALSRGDERIVIKIPVTLAGTTAAAGLVERGVRVCATACYASHQALVATGVGAEYLAPYLGRMGDAGKDGLKECEKMQEIVQGLGGTTRILVASIREVSSLSHLAACGLDTFTFSPAVARELFQLEPLTDAAASQFEHAALPTDSASVADEVFESTVKANSTPQSAPFLTCVAKLALQDEEERGIPLSYKSYMQQRE